jgi:hypothetical protein
MERMIDEVEKDAAEAKSQNGHTDPKQTQGRPGRKRILGSKGDLNFFGASHWCNRTASIAQANLPATVILANVGLR